MSTDHSPLHIRTPLLYSSVLSNQAGAHVYLKLENTQPSGSFKSRGIGHLAQRSLHPLGPSHTHLICSSGGNAGLACAHAALALGTKCTIFVPVTAPARVVAKLRVMGAEVVQGGAHWAEADKAAREAVASVEGGVYVPPFDHPLIVDGHASLVEELDEQLREQRAPPVAAVVCSVGGGGLLAGTLKGMSATNGRLACPVIACETAGAASHAASLKASYDAGGELTMARLDAITTIASTLGATQVSPESVERALQHEGGVVSVVMEDARAVDAVKRLTNDHAFFVEPACSVSLAAIYEPAVLRAALPGVAFAEAGAKPPADAPAIVVVLCGGTTISLDLFQKWEKEYLEGGKGLGPVRVVRKGEEVIVGA